jgi:hypothetical protein
MARGGIPSELGVRDWLPIWGTQVVSERAPALEVSNLAVPGRFSVNDLLFVSLERTHAT